MRRSNIMKYILLVVLSFWGFTTFAYYDEKEKEACRHPKVQEFTLTEYEAPDNKEVPAETEFSFVVSGWADPKKIKLTGKDMDIPFTVDSKETFHKVNAKLPPELTGKFVRINARIPAVLGCYSSVGWLVKVADKSKPAETPKPQDSLAPEAENAGVAVSKEETAPALSGTSAKPENAPSAPEPKTATGEKPAIAP